MFSVYVVVCQDYPCAVEVYGVFAGVDAANKELLSIGCERVKEHAWIKDDVDFYGEYYTVKIM